MLLDTHVPREFRALTRDPGVHARVLGTRLAYVAGGTCGFKTRLGVVRIHARVPRCTARLMLATAPTGSSRSSSSSPSVGRSRGPAMRGVGVVRCGSGGRMETREKK
jgi:hypothetical protein